MCDRCVGCGARRVNPRSATCRAMSAASGPLPGRKTPVRRLEPAKLVVRPQGPHEAQARMLCDAKQQMADLVRHGPAEQRRDGGESAPGNAADRRHIDRHQHAAAPLAIEHRFAKRDDALAVNRCAVDQPQHEVASGEQRFGAHCPSISAGHAAIDPFDRDTRRPKDMPGLRFRGGELAERHGGIVVRPHGDHRSGDGAASTFALRASADRSLAARFIAVRIDMKKITAFMRPLCGRQPRASMHAR